MRVADFRTRFFARKPFRLRWTAIVLLAVVALWGIGLVRFADRAAAMTPAGTVKTDAIVVLTGGSERLSVGLELLAAGHARKLFVSGVYAGVEVAELLQLSQRAPEDVECCIALGYVAGDTRGNAIETAEWMRSEGFSSLRLVTSNYHMQRSLLELHAALPEARIVAHPVTPARVHLRDWWNWPGTASLIVGEYMKYLMAVSRLRFSSLLEALTDGAAESAT